MAMYKRKFVDLKYHPRERRRALILACLLFWSIISYLVISHYVLGGTEVVGDSMLPTLHNGDRYVIERFAYLLRQPARGEIVALQVPRWDDLTVKRIIAYPSEYVQFRHGQVLVNGQALPEPYLPHGTLTRAGDLSTNVYMVEPGCYFVLGDNRSNSCDSRFFGAVRRDWIVGRIAGL